MNKLNFLKDYLHSIKNYLIGTKDELESSNNAHLDGLYCTQYFVNLYTLMGPVLAAELEMPAITLVSALFMADTIQRVVGGAYIMSETNPGIIGTLRNPNNWKTEIKLEKMVTT